MWHCVEERSNGVNDYGRFQRKVVFDNIYADRQSLLTDVPLPVNTQTQLKVRKSEDTVF